MEPSPAPPVIIIGAGLVGLILAQALSARSIPYLIYDQDPHASHRGVGWGLTIHWALEIFKYLVPASIIKHLPEAFVDPDAVRSGEKGNFLFYDLRKGNALWKVPPSERLRLRREAFRELLLQNVNVQWESRSMSSKPLAIIRSQLILLTAPPHLPAHSSSVVMALDRKSENC
jgi:flavin-dependent dehydrogenase